MKRLLYVVPVGLLCAGLILLHGIFVRERTEALRALQDRDIAVVRAAQQTLRMRLDARLHESGPAVTAAVEDPLLDDAPFLLVRGGRQVLPRPFETARGGPAGSEARAEPLWNALETRGPGPLARAGDMTKGDAAFAERLRLTEAFVRALDGGSTAELERTMRSLLAHRAHEQLQTTADVVLTLWTLERFAQKGSPEPSLMRALLRDGLRGERGAHLPGLQRVMLSRYDQLHAADVPFLSTRLIALSERSGVEAEDFGARVKTAPARRVVLSGLPSREPMLAYGYYVEQDGLGEARGVRVDLPTEVERVTDEMRGLSLLELTESLTLPVPEGPVALSALVLKRSSALVDAARARIHERHAMKSGLLLGSGVFGVGFIVFAGLAGSRKRRLVALRGELLATVSHELRTPLSAIRVMAETLQRRAEGAPGVGDYPARIVGEADALGRLVENILAFNRLEKGRLQARIEDLPLRDVLTSVAEDVAASAPVPLHLDASAVGDARVKADPQLLRILLSNLLHNACRHGAKDEVRVTAWAGLEGEWMTVRLTDDGRGGGIPRESWERIFDAFERLPSQSAQAKGGSGLGLAICRRIMRLHRGDIRVVRSGPEGTTFEVGFKP